MILESIKTVFKVFKSNKMRTFLTMIGMIIGIFSISMIFSLTGATRNAMTNKLNMISSQTIYLNYFKADYIQNVLIENALKEYVNRNKLMYLNVDDFNPSEIIYTLENANYFDNYYLPEFIGVDENYFDICKMENKLLYGRLLSKKDIINKMPYVVLRDDVAKILFGKVNVVGQTLNIENYDFEVIGVFKHDTSQLSDFDSVGMFISYYYAKEFLDSSSFNLTIYVNNENINQIKDDLKQIMDDYISTDNYFISVSYYSQVLDSIENLIEIVELVLVGIAGLSIVVGGIGIMNIMLVSVSERIRETGIRMALGAKNKDIVFQFLIEGIMITIFSGIIGIILACIATSVVNLAFSSSGYDFVLSINFISMVKIIIFCGIIGIIFGIYPAIKAGRLDPIEALKYE